MGGVAAPLLGVLADADGLRSVFELIIIFPLVALALSLLLPVRRDPGHQAPAQPASVRRAAPTQPQRSPA
jgi:hypothetical protein